MAQTAEYTRTWRAGNRERSREHSRRAHLRHEYGISEEQYDEMFRRQGGLCAVCEQPEKVRRLGKLLRLAVDHDHVTGRVRGLVCNHCNRVVLRIFDRQPGLLEKVTKYLDREVERGSMDRKKPKPKPKGRPY